MTEVSGFALFCEDIRHESGGSESLMGVLPQGITLPGFPFTANRIGVYARIMVARSWSKGTIVCSLEMPNNFVRDLGIIDETELTNIAANTDDFYEELGITLVSVSSYNFTEAGTMSLVLKYQEEQLLIAQLIVTGPPNPHTD
jgi:hypothetical protein